MLTTVNVINKRFKNFLEVTIHFTKIIVIDCFID